MALAHPTAGLGGPVLQVLQSSSIMTCWSDLKLGRHAVIITRYTSLLTCWTDQPHCNALERTGYGWLTCRALEPRVKSGL